MIHIWRKTNGCCIKSKSGACSTPFAKMKAQFDTTQIVEITTAIAAYNMVARILVPLGVGT